MKTENQIIQEELAKHGVTPKSSTPADVKKESKPKTKVEPEVVSAVEPKKTDVTISLTEAEIAGLTREANLIGITWQTHLGDLVMETLSSRVAKTLITGPSYAAKKVTGPSNLGGHYLGA